MMGNLNQYLMKAFDAYPYDLKGTIESLDYAMSYDNENPMTLCLYGKVYAEQFLDYKSAIQYFSDALAADLDAVYVYPLYIQALIDYEEYDQADKLIEYAMKVKGVNKSDILCRAIISFEKQLKFNKALKCLKRLKGTVLSNDYQSFVDSATARIKQKKSGK